MLHQALCIISKPWVNSNWNYSPETLNLGQSRRFFVPCELEIWQMTLKNNRAPVLCCFKLCVSLHSHQWIQTGVIVKKRPLFGSKSMFFVPCDLDIWQMTFKNNRAPLLCYFKFCASFRCHWGIQTGVKSVKMNIFDKKKNRRLSLYFSQGGLPGVNNVSATGAIQHNIQTGGSSSHLPILVWHIVVLLVNLTWLDLAHMVRLPWKHHKWLKLMLPFNDNTVKSLI